MKSEDQALRSRSLLDYNEMKKSYTDKFIPSQSVEQFDRRTLLKNHKKSFETYNDEDAEPVDLVIKY